MSPAFTARLADGRSLSASFAIEPLGGFPSASTTGVPAGTTLRASGSVTVSTAGIVIDGLDIAGTVVVNASNVTLKRCRITGSSWIVVKVADGATGVRIEDCEINGKGATGNAFGIAGPAAVARCNIYGVENGWVPSTGGSLRDSYIHDLKAPGSPHYDGIQIDGDASNIVIDHNTIDLSEFSQTAAVMIDNYYGPIDNIIVNNNRLLGGGYTVYSDGQFSGGAIKGVQFTRNRFGRGYWGYALIRKNTVAPVQFGNVDDVTGAPITL